MMPTLSTADANGNDNNVLSPSVNGLGLSLSDHHRKHRLAATSWGCDMMMVMNPSSSNDKPIAMPLAPPSSSSIAIGTAPTTIGALPLSSASSSPRSPTGTRVGPPLPQLGSSSVPLGKLASLQLRDVSPSLPLYYPPPSNNHNHPNDSLACPSLSFFLSHYASTAHDIFYQLLCPCCWALPTGFSISVA